MLMNWCPRPLTSGFEAIVTSAEPPFGGTVAVPTYGCAEFPAPLPFPP